VPVDRACLLLGVTLVAAHVTGACGGGSSIRSVEAPKILSLTAVAPAKAALADDPEAADHLIREGARLPNERVHEIEEQLDKNPADLESRLMLLGYYGRSGGEAGPSGEPYDTLIIGLFEQFPGSVLAGELGSSDASFERRTSLWRKLVAKNPNDAAILGNAGMHLADSDDEREGEQLLGRAESLAPSDPRWPWALGFVGWARIAGPDASIAESRGAAERAMARLEHAFELARSSPPRWLVPKVLFGYERLTELAFIAGDLQRTRTYANFTLEVARSWQVDWERADAVNAAETLLGYVELATGHLGEAERHLIASAQTSGSPVLGSYGPDLGLAAELLARGRSQRVLEYLDLCKRFWDPGPGVIDGWQTAIRSGASPDFGGLIHTSVRRALAFATKK
jgi:tetratricopeptide (TPR) repeat protein